MKWRPIILLAAVAAFLTCAPAGAQSFSGKGIKIGLSFAKLGKDVDGDSDVKTGAAVGGFVTLGLTGSVELQPEILYVERGGKYDLAVGSDAGIPAGSGETRYYLDYVEFPLLARVSLPAAGKARPYVITGPALAWAISSKLKTETGEGTKQKREAVEADLENIKDVDRSWVFGAGVDIDLNRTKWTADLRYNLGLSNINDLDASGDAEIKNRTWTFTIGYRF